MRREVMLVGVATAVLVASCAPSDDEIIVDRSGSRLKLTWMVTPDGSRIGVADGLYDATLRIKCAPGVSLTEVDVQPCLPPGTGVVSTFADAGCTRPVTGRSEQPYFVTQRDCRIRVFKPAGTATVAATYGLDADGACAPLTPSTKPESQEWYEGVEVPLSTFAELRLVREPGAGRLRRLGIRSMDGMATSLRGMAYDSALETVCGVDRFSCDPLATLPTGYASGTCSERIAFADKLAPSCSHFPVVAAKSGACTAEQYFPVTGPAGAGIPLEESSTGCWRNPRTSYSSFFQLGKPVSPATVREETDEAPGHRFRAIRNVSSDGFRSEPALFYDAEQEWKCQVAESGSEPLACLPVGTSDLGVSPSRYLDPACTDEVLSRVTDYLGCPAPRGEASDFVAREEVAGGWRIYRVGERVGPLLNAYARDRDGVCRQGELVPGNVECYRIGPYVRTVKPVPLTLVTDP